MLFRNLLLPGVVVPAVVAAVGVLLAAWARRRPAPLAAGPAVAAAFLGAFVAMTGWPRWLPVEASQRLFFLVALAALLGLAWAWIRPAATTWIVRAVAVGVPLVLLLKTPLEYTWSTAQAALWLTGLLAAGLALLRALEARFDPDRSAPSLLAAAVLPALLGGTAVVLGLSASARLAQLAGALAVAVVVVEVVAKLLGRRPWIRGDALPVAVGVLGLLLIGYFYAQLEPLPALLLLAAYLLLALPGDAWWRRLVPLLPLIVALGLVIATEMQEEEDPYGDYYTSVVAAPENPPAIDP
jgi:hypothetical protein